MYDAFPAFLWVVISINIFFSLYTIIQSCDSQVQNSYYGYFSILLLETIMIILPIIRGYYSMSSGTADIYYHMLTANQIFNSGYLPITDIYPIMHLWLSILHNFFSDYIILTLVLSIVFFIFYILSLYILGKTVLGTKNGGIFFSLFGLPLIFSYGHYAFYPFLFALFLFPIILYTYQKIIHYPSQKNSYYICLLFLSLFVVFCHPMISVFLIIVFSIFTFFGLFKRWVTGQQSNIEAANIVIIVSLTLTLWWFQFRYVLDTLQNMVFSFIGQESSTSILNYQLDLVRTSDASIWLVIDRFIKVYGPICIYFSISLFFLCYMIYQYFQNKKIHEDDLIYSLQFFVALGVGAALLTGYFVIFEPIRAAMYGLVFASILCGLFFYLVLQPRRHIISMTMIITIVCIVAIMTLFTSPWIGLMNPALTYEDKNRLDWVLEYRNAEIPMVKEESVYNRYSEYYFETMNTKNSPKDIEYIYTIPSHFGYDTNKTIGDSLAYLADSEYMITAEIHDVYMITTEQMNLLPYVFPIERRDRVKQFDNNDYIRLMNDPTLKLVYSTNEFKVSIVNIKS
jgi:hypothetical protein